MAFLIAPSQFSAAVAGVQLASRQQSSFVPFFQVVPVLLTQLSTVVDWAKAPEADIVSATDAAVAMSDATLLSLFMILL